MLDKRFKHEYGCWHTDNNTPVNNVIDLIVCYNCLFDEHMEDYGKKVLIILRKGVALTGQLLDKMGLIKVNCGITFDKPEIVEGYPVDDRIFITTGMTEAEVNNLINKQL